MPKKVSRDFGRGASAWGEAERGARGGGAAAPPRHRHGRAVGARAESAPRALATALTVLYRDNRQHVGLICCKLSATTLTQGVCSLLFF